MIPYVYFRMVHLITTKKGAAVGFYNEESRGVDISLCSSTKKDVGWIAFLFYRVYFYGASST
jgi:hypothetical protein